MSKWMTRLWRFLFETNDSIRMSRQHPDISTLALERDIPYLEDGDKGHLMDIYRPKDAPDDIPVIINIHGGGLFAAYKEVNRWFNYEWAKKGYAVVGISYRRIPDTTLIHQIEDVMTALRFIHDNSERLRINLDRCYLTGDSAGALLSYLALCLEGSATLQKEFGISACGIHFRAAGLISIMLDTQRHDLMSAISDVVTDRNDNGKAYEPYLLNPASMAGKTTLPPIYLVTSSEDLIREDTLKFERTLTDAGVAHKMLDFPKGKKEKLIHVFSVQYPLWPESVKVYSEIDSFFKEH